MALEKRSHFHVFSSIVVSRGKMRLDLAHDNSVNFGRILKCFILLEFARPLLESHRIGLYQNQSKSIEMRQKRVKLC